MEMSSVKNNLGNTTQIKEKDMMINNNELITLSGAIENGKNLPKEKENLFGPWMLMKHAVRKKERITTQGRGVNYAGGNKGNQAKGSRFNALHQEESEMDVDEIMVEMVTDMHESHVVHVQHEESGLTQNNRRNEAKSSKVKSPYGGRNPQQKSEKYIQAQPFEKKIKSLEKNKPNSITPTIVPGSFGKETVNSSHHEITVE